MDDGLEGAGAIEPVGDTPGQQRLWFGEKGAVVVGGVSDIIHAIHERTTAEFRCDTEFANLQCLGIWLRRLPRDRWLDDIGFRLRRGFAERTATQGDGDQSGCGKA